MDGSGMYGDLPFASFNTNNSDIFGQSSSGIVIKKAGNYLISYNIQVLLSASGTANHSLKLNDSIIYYNTVRNNTTSTCAGNLSCAPIFFNINENSTLGVNINGATVLANISHLTVIYLG